MKELPIIIKPSELTFSIFSKTKSLIARPLGTLLIDSSILTKFLLSTLEGDQGLGKEDTIVCVGQSDDVWQQPKNKFLQKYDVTDFTTDGWMVATPKPENKVNSVEVTEDMTQNGEFAIIGQWGQKGYKEGPIQFGNTGDFICQNQTDLTDVWIVKRGLFNSSYEEVKLSVESSNIVNNVIPLFKKVV